MAYENISWEADCKATSHFDGQDEVNSDVELAKASHEPYCKTLNPFQVVIIGY